MTEKEVAGGTYRFGKISALKQWHIVRRVAPALVGVAGLAGLKDAAVIRGADLVAKIEPFLAALGNMSDEDTEYVLDNCLAVVSRKIEGDRGWQTVGDSGALQFEDIDLAVMLQLAFEAAKENLAGFFDAARSIFPTVAAPK